jgi:hypothetical protein
VTHNRPAARAERQTVELIFLRQIRRQHHDVAGRGGQGAPDSQAADLLRRGEIPLEQRRRELADPDIVETMADIVFREE